MIRRAALIALLALAACGKSKPSPPTLGAPEAPAPAPRAAPTTPDVDVEAFCAATMAGKNPAQCYGKDARAEQIKTSMCAEVLGGALRQGHVTIDPAKLAACQHATEAGIASLDNERGLGDLAHAFAACRDATTGTLGVGADCLGTMECAPGLTCLQLHCAAPGAEGAKCQPQIELTLSASDTTCAAGLTCDLGSFTCRARAAAGGACKLTDECRDGLQCRADTCVAAKPSKHDGPCDRDPDCPAGDFCSLSRRCETLRADGAECLTNGQCAHQCVSAPSGGDGDRCGPCPP